MKKIVLSALMLAGAGAIAQPAPRLDIQKSFATRSPWQLRVSQGPDIPDPIGQEDKVPGPIRLCLTRDGGKSCQTELEHMLALPTGDDLYAEPHFLQDVRIVYPGPRRPLLLVRVGSLRGGNGDQRVAVAMLAYDRVSDSFSTIYRKRTGRNNNQEIRYIGDGVLKGAILSAEPTDDAPFGFWMTVDRIAATGRYAQVLRYRSATRYGDGNPLAVIDSEMANIQGRLGLWHAGAKLPVPPGKCPNPHLQRQAIWC